MGARQSSGAKINGEEPTVHSCFYIVISMIENDELSTEELFKLSHSLG